MKSSFDIESWRELPLCLGETSSNWKSMLNSWEMGAFPFISDGWLGCWLSPFISDDCCPHHWSPLVGLSSFSCSPFLVPSPSPSPIPPLLPPRMSVYVACMCPTLSGFLAAKAAPLLVWCLWPILVSTLALLAPLVLSLRSISSLGTPIAGDLWACFVGIFITGSHGGSSWDVGESWVRNWVGCWGIWGQDCGQFLVGIFLGILEWLSVCVEGAHLRVWGLGGLGFVMICGIWQLIACLMHRSTWVSGFWRCGACFSWDLW